MQTLTFQKRIMQTFLPYNNFSKSADILDKRRCWQQVRESHLIYRTVIGESEGWKNHPAVRMWAPYDRALALYYNMFFQTCKEKWQIKIRAYTPLFLLSGENVVLPNWLGDERLHASHRSNLLRKNYEYYSQFNWTENTDLPYYWPK